MRNDVIAREYSRNIIMHAAEHNQRTGQYLFNSLPKEVSVHVTGMLWDPFRKNLSQYQIEDWLNDHIVFDDNGSITGLFSGNKLLWER